MTLYSMEPNRIGNYEIICTICGKTFKAALPHAKYCSTECSTAAFIKQRKEKRIEQRKKKCVVCGVEFQAKRHDTQFCSPKCKQKHYRVTKNGCKTKNRNNVTNTSCGNIATTQNSNKKRTRKQKWMDEEKKKEEQLEQIRKDMQNCDELKESDIKWKYSERERIKYMKAITTYPDLKGLPVKQVLLAYEFRNEQLREHLTEHTTALAGARCYDVMPTGFKPNISYPKDLPVFDFKEECILCRTKEKAISLCPDCWVIIAKALELTAQEKKGWHRWGYEMGIDMEPIRLLLERNKKKLGKFQYRYKGFKLDGDR